MKKVILHIYDVTNNVSAKTNNTILQINKIFKDGIGLGGIFHSAVQVFGDEEWSFGFCETGSGVFSCTPCKNPMYTYRESIVLGETSLTSFKVNYILRELSREWPGTSYDLLAQNCNHFCDEFCERLGVPKLPAWVNRFANAGDAAVEVAANTAIRWKQAKTEIATAGKVVCRFISGVTSSESPNNPSRVAPRFQGSWFKNLISVSTKPSASADQTEEALQQKQHKCLQKQKQHKPTEQQQHSKPSASSDQAEEALQQKQHKCLQKQKQHKPTEQQQHSKPSASSDQAEEAIQQKQHKCLQKLKQFKPTEQQQHSKPSATSDQAEEALQQKQHKPTEQQQHSKPSSSSDQAEEAIQQKQHKCLQKLKQFKPTEQQQHSKPSASSDQAE